MRDRAVIDDLHKAIDIKFEANHHKGTWRNMSDHEVLFRLSEEINELVEAVRLGDYDNAILEAADVALFAVFFADKMRGGE